MSNLENEITQDNSSENVTVKIDASQLSEVKDIKTFNNITVDEVFKKKVNFLGLMQQIYGVLLIIAGGLYCLTIIGAIFGIPIIIIGMKVFKSGEAYKKSMLTLEGKDLKDGLILFSDAIYIYLIIILTLTFIFGGILIVALIGASLR